MVRPQSDYSQVFDIYLPIACAVFALVLVGILYALVFRRRRRADAPLPGSQKSEHTRIEGAYVLVLLLIAAFLVTTTFTVEAKEDKVTSAPGVAINVTAAQWSWRFQYPAYAVTSTSTAVHHATLTVPAGTPIHLRMTSTDVIHAFYVPTQRFKRDAFPGTYNDFDLYFQKPGFLLNGGSCAEYCGLFHADMLFDVRVLSPAAFQAWAAANRGSASA